MRVFSDGSLKRHGVADASADKTGKIDVLHLILAAAEPQRWSIDDHKTLYHINRKPNSSWANKKCLLFCSTPYSTDRASRECPLVFIVVVFAPRRQSAAHHSRFCSCSPEGDHQAGVLFWFPRRGIACARSLVHATWGVRTACNRWLPQLQQRLHAKMPPTHPTPAAKGAS